MKTILWKELRENSRWIPLGLLPMSLILWLQWVSGALVIRADEELMLSYGFLASFLGFALGLVQSWPDQRPAARALLLHRGITADAAFVGKLLSGFLIYASAVLLPMAIFALWIMADDLTHRAVSPGTLWPTVLTALFGFCGWPMGVVLIYRDAKLFGSRFLPAITGGTAFSAGALILTGEPWIGITLQLLTLSLFVHVAWRVFVSAGHVATGTSRVSLAFLVAVSLLIGTTLVSACLESYRRNQTVVRAAGRDHGHYTITLGPDGQAWMVRVDGHTRNAWHWQTIEADQAARLKPHEPARSRLEPVSEWHPATQWNLPRTSPPIHSNRRFMTLSIGVVSQANYVQRGLVYDARDGLLLDYRKPLGLDWRRVATLRRSGGSRSLGRVLYWGNGDPNGSMLLVSSTGLHRVMADPPEIETIYQVPTGRQIVALDTGRTFLQRNTYTRELHFMLRLSDRVVFIESQQHDGARSLGRSGGMPELFATTVALPNEIAVSREIRVARHPDVDSYVAMLQDGTPEQREVVWVQFDRNGQVQSRQTFSESIVPDFIYEDDSVLAFIPPIGLVVGTVGAAIATGSIDPIESAWENTIKKPAKAIGRLVLITVQPLLGVPLAIWAVRKRRAGKRAGRAWIAWGLLFGPMGALAILAVYPRIHVEPCPACQSPSRTDRVTCECCGQSLDTPSTSTVGIFDIDKVKRGTPRTYEPAC